MPNQSGVIPPVLPPSVEEAYRRKCIQLRRRMNEVEEANEASRLRLHRMRRGIEKMRLERAFLLEQLAKRTSTNVEDSDGSPSPPPTPKEKPLRTKRGHRRPSVLKDLDTAATPNLSNLRESVAGPPTLSPSGSDAFSLAAPAALPALPAMRPFAPPASTSNGTNGKKVSRGTPRAAKNPFELFAAEVAAQQKDDPKAGQEDLEEDTARQWRDMPDTEKEVYVERLKNLEQGGRERSDEDVEMEEGDDDEGEE